MICNVLGYFTPKSGLGILESFFGDFLETFFGDFLETFWRLFLETFWRLFGDFLDTFLKSLGDMVHKTQ